MKTATTHVIGAGLAGLSAATALAAAGKRVVLHEATAHAGGRCRSYFDRALGMEIDNGNHIVLSGNTDAMAYLDRIGARRLLSGPESARFPFYDAASGERWTVDLGSGRLPRWLLDPGKRVPATKILDYLPLALMTLRPGAGAVAAAARREPLYARLVEPVLLATLNNDPAVSSAKLAAAVLRGSVARGGRHCRPLVATGGLSRAFVDPALEFLRERGAVVRFGRKLRGLRLSDDRVEALEFEGGTVALEAGDAVVAAVPPQVAATLVPGLVTPDEFRPIANIHFRIDGEPALPAMTGLVNATAQWVFNLPGRVSVTISNAGSVMQMDREALARHIWSEIVQMTGSERPMPAWQVVNERRATFATLPEQEVRRPPARTRWRNLMLAGDWVDTGLPPTIEGAVRSGRTAATLLAAGGR